jgi:hypothetical protein
MKRADAILLVSGSVLVIELKGDGNEEEGYLEQVADYARHLYWYHQLCGSDGTKVHTLVVSYGIRGASKEREWITLTNIDELKAVVAKFDQPGKSQPIPVEVFIRPELCQPSPSLVRAVRDFYSKNQLPRIKRIDDITSPAVERVVAEIHQANSAKRRKLILLSGVPGAGKTFVGMQIAHESFLDDLSEPMPGGEKPTAPAVFLSGNAPLVQVLQYEMQQAGGGGRVFVKHVHEFVKRFSKKHSPPPPHHVLIFDEAQRAWDAAKVKNKHNARRLRTRVVYPICQPGAGLVCRDGPDRGRAANQHRRRKRDETVGERRCQRRGFLGGLRSATFRSHLPSSRCSLHRF